MPVLLMVAFGAQDVYLTGSPQITYFKVVFKRHTNFAIEPISQTFSGSVRYGSKVTAVISRNGDLLGDMWLEAVMTKSGLPGSTFYPGEQLVKSITVELGGQQLDKLTATWYRIYDNLYRNSSTDRAAYRKMVDFVDGEVATTSKRMMIPVLFWFCRSPGNYLPLIALTQLRTAARKSIVPGSQGSEPGKTTWAPFNTPDASRLRQAAPLSRFMKWGERCRPVAGNTAKLFGEPVKPVEYQRVCESVSWLRANS